MVGLEHEHAVDQIHRAHMRGDLRPRDLAPLEQWRASSQTLAHAGLAQRVLQDAGDGLQTVSSGRHVCRVSLRP